MGTIEVYNLFDGKNLCNLFANTIVEELKKINPNVMVEISVINVRNFFIVRGKTDSKTVLNLTDIFSNKLENLMFEKPDVLKVIDIITYNTSLNSGILNISKTNSKSLKTKYLDFVNLHTKNKLYFSLKVDELHSTIIFDCFEQDIKKVTDVISLEFTSYDIIKGDFSSEVYVSDSEYGMNINSEKSYYMLIDYVSNHLFHLGLCDEVTINLYSKNELKVVDNLNCELTVKTNKSFVKEEWLSSLILDLFPFELNEIIKELNLDSYNFENRIIDNQNPWSNLSKVREFILI
jgi:S-adenosylmethionine synthetase